MTERIEWESKLKPGDPVEVFWGLGLGFRAHGYGVIEKVFAKSFRVRLTAPAWIRSQHGLEAEHGPKPDWPAGYVLKGIPRVFGTGWDPYRHCVARAHGNLTAATLARAN